MKKQFSRRTFTAFALVLALAAPAVHPAMAQSEAPRHLAPGELRPADRPAFDARRGELATAAKIYGYNLAEGNWTFQQTLCPPMPRTILLQYQRRFPDGTESRFLALVPRIAGRVRIVPVLYHGATPFVPAPKNPRNYALFNSLVPPAIGLRDAVANQDWLDLAACYAEMTGGRADLASARGAKPGIAGEPSPTVNLDFPDKTARVTFAERDGRNSYRLWSISFSKTGAVTAAATEEESVPPHNQPEVATASPHNHSELATAPLSSHPQIATESNGQTAELEPQSQSSAPPPAQPERAAEAAAQPGWKPILNPAQPPIKFIPAAPPPPSKMIPEPPDEFSRSAVPPQS